MFHLAKAFVDWFAKFFMKRKSFVTYEGYPHSKKAWKHEQWYRILSRKVFRMVRRL